MSSYHRRFAPLSCSRSPFRPRPRCPCPVRPKMASADRAGSGRRRTTSSSSTTPDVGSTSWMPYNVLGPFLRLYMLQGLGAPTRQVRCYCQQALELRQRVAPEATENYVQDQVFRSTVVVCTSHGTATGQCAVCSVQHSVQRSVQCLSTHESRKAHTVPVSVGSGSACVQRCSMLPCTRTRAELASVC